MEGLTKEQIIFLKEQNIHLKFVFDADGLSKSEYRLIMKELNKIIAYNVTPCRKAGHTLRTRSGHCCQCDTAKIAFQKRNSLSGIVYIAGSLNGKVIKIGFSKAVNIREESLNKTKYAGFDDWKILFALISKDSGQIETKSNSVLNKYIFSLNYKHDGHWQNSYETYHCALSKAKGIIEDIYLKEDYNVEIVKNIQTNKYEFENLLKL